MIRTGLSALAIACLALCGACGDDDDGGDANTGGTGAASTGDSGAASIGGSGSTDDGATCKATCPAVVAAGCDLAPESVEACEQQCEDFLAESACDDAWAELQACAEGKDIVCTSGTPSLPAPEGCESLQQQFVTCYVTSG